MADSDCSFAQDFLSFFLLLLPENDFISLLLNESASLFIRDDYFSLCNTNWARTTLFAPLTFTLLYVALSLSSQ
jgi:hypothetical protein